MYQYHCLNPIAEKGLNLFSDNYKKAETLEGSDAVLVRSAKMHDMELPESVCAIARAGAGVNNIPVKECAEKGIVVYLPSASVLTSTFCVKTASPASFVSARCSVPPFARP